MTKISVSAIGLLFATTTLAAAHDEKALMNAPAGDPYVQVSDVLPLPEFTPGLGTLFVDPATPARWGDRNTNLVLGSLLTVGRRHCREHQPGRPKMVAREARHPSNIESITENDLQVPQRDVS